MKQISLQMYTLREFMKTPADFENTLARVAEMGYRHVQITPPPFHTGESLAKSLAAHGLAADSAICTVYRIPEKMEEIVRDAAALGTDVLRTDSIREADRGSEEGYHAFARHLNTCGKLLADRGLLLMYHFHAFEFVRFADGRRGIDILLSETDPATVFFQPDVFWLTAAGTEASRSLTLFRGRAKYIHLKDYVILPGAERLEETHPASAPVGSGNLCWSEIFRTADEMGIANFVAEDDMGQGDPFASAAESYRFLSAHR